MGIEDDENFLTVPQVAQVLGVAEKTIYRYINKNEIPAQRIGKWRLRIHASDVLAFLKQRQATYTFASWQAMYVQVQLHPSDHLIDSGPWWISAQVFHAAREHGISIEIPRTGEWYAQALELAYEALVTDPERRLTIGQIRSILEHVKPHELEGEQSE